MQSVPVANPFALLLNPSAVLAEIEHSERLNRLSSRICRPLDKQATQGATAEDAVSDAKPDDDVEVRQVD